MSTLNWVLINLNSNGVGELVPGLKKKKKKKEILHIYKE